MWVSEEDYSEAESMSDIFKEQQGRNTGRTGGQREQEAR